MSNRSINVGVAVVHGIGLQKPDETLAKFGSPIATWLTDWVAETRSEVRVEFERTSSERETIAVTLASDDAPPERWTVVETHWADSFKAPPYARFIAWLLGAVPWTMLWLLGSPIVAYGDALARAERHLSDVGGPRTFLWLHLRHPIRTLAWLLGFLGSLASALLDIVIRLACLLLVLPFVLAAALAGMVPAARGWIIPLLGTAGDSYAFVAFPAERDAMLARLRADIGYLEARCDRVVIVAHSQGAALAHQVLSGAPPRRRCTFISLGAGVAPLLGLSVLRESTRHWRLLGLALIAFLAFAEGLLVIAMVPGVAELLKFAFVGAMVPLVQIREVMADTAWNADWSAMQDLNASWFDFMAQYQQWSAAYDVGLVAQMVVLSVPLVITSFWFRKTRAIERWQVAARLPKRVRNRVRWVDVHTARDPVPIGRLLAPYAKRSVQVTNLASLARDHSLYERNRHEVLPLIAYEIGCVGRYGDRLFPPETVAALSAAQRARAVAVNRAARWGDVAGLSAILGLVLVAAGALSGRPFGGWLTLAGASLVGLALARRHVRALATKASLLAVRGDEGHARRARIRRFGWAAATGLLANLGLALTVAPYPPDAVVPPSGDALLLGVTRLPLVTFAALGFLLALVVLSTGRRWGLHVAIMSALVTVVVVMPIWPLAGVATLTSLALLAILARGLWCTRTSAAVT